MHLTTSHLLAVRKLLSLSRKQHGTRYAKKKRRKKKAMISWSSKIEFITYYLYLKKNQYDK
jgi:hypothetical protein